jgi:DNA adenine methylase
LTTVHSDAIHAPRIKEDEVKLSTQVPHPIPYQGSKRNLASVILSFAPEKVGRLVEPFAGSAAVSLAASLSQQASRFWVNDAHSALVDLWREIIDRPEQLARRYHELWDQQLGREREFFNFVRSEFNQSHRPEHFLYLLARCVKAAIRYNGNGEFNNTPDNRRLGARPAEMASRIMRASQLLRARTKLTSRDYREVLDECTASDLIYMDPPYQGVCEVRDTRYRPKIDHDEFAESLCRLNKKSCLYLVSYDGRTGPKYYGRPLPKSLGLVHLEVPAGRSTQATLLGRRDVTYESLYLSPALAAAIGTSNNGCGIRGVLQACC